MIHDRAIAAAHARTRSGKGRGVRRRRQGMNLLEIMIVVGIMVGLLVIAFPLIGWVLRLEEKRTANNLVGVYSRLHDEAVMRNLTFRIAYHLDDRYYEVEVSEDPALLFTDPEKRAEFEALQQEKMQRQASRFASDEAGMAVDEDGLSVDAAAFTAVQDKFNKRFDLPSGLVFGGVYTPAYGELVEPNGGDPSSLDEDEKVVVYSYILPSGISEHAVVQIVQEGNPDNGFSIEVEPMTGRVHLTQDLGAWEDRMSFVPDRAPDIP